MKFTAYNAACRTGYVDPLVLLGYLRTAHRSPAARKFGSNPYSRPYRELRRRLASPVDLPSDNPFSPSPETARLMNALVRREAQLKGALCHERI